ncbi:substrate-binding domain-containing protein [Bradyrhizobium sp. CB3481]|uniref:substrate-binding domain-containing protein n=1 Tax=Bradyrhizobium sp. CB3481 TaxID=3039158 RepID=UPI0024B0C181|nr:substrate-binding domain-containing protein [Bradyrhizobium sp. CB3481]WFU14929.1 hypothetical protein QA643_28655 [Bradyrhizobium sp. CB3481]
MRLVRLILINATLIPRMLGDVKAANIKVAVAANFNEPAKEIAASLKEKAELSFGASGLLLSQLTQGVSFQMFLSADGASRSRRLVTRELLVPILQGSVLVKICAPTAK